MSDRAVKRFQQDVELNGFKILDNGVEVVPGGGGGGDGLPDPNGVDGAVLRDNGVAFVEQRLTQDDIDPAFAIASFSLGVSGTKELGDTIVNPNFTASYLAAIKAPLTVNDGVNTDTVPLLNQSAFAYNANGVPARSYVKSGINQTVTWTLTATKDPAGPIKARATSATWQARRYYDITTVPGSYNETFIEGLAQNQISSGRAGTYAFGAGSATKKIYLCWPTAFGDPGSIKDANGFTFPMAKVATAVVVTNTFGVLVPGGYDVWESSNFIIAPFTLTVA